MQRQNGRKRDFKDKKDKKEKLEKVKNEGLIMKERVIEIKYHTAFLQF